MTTDLFHVDYEHLSEVLITIVVLSFLLERALAVIFESQWFILWSEGTLENPKPRKSAKEILASTVCIAFCSWQDSDSISIILQSSECFALHYFQDRSFVASKLIEPSAKASENFEGSFFADLTPRKYMSKNLGPL